MLCNIAGHVVSKVYAVDYEFQETNCDCLLFRRIILSNTFPK